MGELERATWQLIYDLSQSMYARKPKPGPEERARQIEQARQIERLRSDPVFMAKLRELAAEENAKWRIGQPRSPLVKLWIGLSGGTLKDLKTPRTP